MTTQVEPRLGPATVTPAPLIELREVEKVYRTGKIEFTALRGVDLAVIPGEMVAVVGPSGSGKTTILNLISGIDRPTSGHVVVDGADLTTMNEERLARWRGRTVGIVFQFFQLLPTLTALENAALPMDFASAGGRPRSVGSEPGATWKQWVSGTRSTISRSSCPEASSSGSPSPGRSPVSRSWSWATNRPATWTARPAD